MKASLRLPGIALAVLFWGCDETPVTPSVAFQIGGYAMADGQTFPSGLPDTQPIPSETQTLVFYASVSAPAGSWQLAATAGGAFALAACADARFMSFRTSWDRSVRRWPRSVWS